MGIKAHLSQPFHLQLPAMEAFQQMTLALTIAVQQQGPGRMSHLIADADPGQRSWLGNSPLHPAALFFEHMSASKAGPVAEMLDDLCCIAWPPLRPAGADGQHYQMGSTINHFNS